ARVHQPAPDCRPSRNRRRSRHAHRQECWRLGLARHRGAESTLAHQAPSQLVQLAHVQPKLHSQVLQRRASLLRLAHLLQCLLLALAQGFCPRHRLPPSSRRIAVGGSLRHSDHGRKDGVTGVLTHNRPVHEVLFPNRLPLEPAFSGEFAGLTTDEVTLETLEQTQSRLIDELPRALTSRHRDFLLSLVSAEPAWDLAPFANLQHFPAPQWKLINLRTLKKRNPGRFSAQHDELASRF